MRSQVSCGPSFCLAVTPGNVWSWGTGEGFVLGHGDTIKRDTPYQIEAFKGSAVLQVSTEQTRGWEDDERELQARVNLWLLKRKFVSTTPFLLFERHGHFLESKRGRTVVRSCLHLYQTQKINCM